MCIIHICSVCILKGMGHLIGNHVTYEPVLMLVFGIDGLPPSLLLVQEGYSATEDNYDLTIIVIIGTFFLM